MFLSALVISNKVLIVFQLTEAWKIRIALFSQKDNSQVTPHKGVQS